MEKCAYCSKTFAILQLCPHCEKVCYCSQGHMAADHDTHQPHCFPAVIQYEDGCGRYWVASRDISRGELIFVETALVLGPNTDVAVSSSSISNNFSPLYPTCLGCCRGTNTSYFCSKCKWPVCSKTCEKVRQHSDFECKVFRKNKVHWSSRPQYYLFIQLLRAFLLRDVNPAAFRKMMELEPHVKPRQGHQEESQLSKSFFKFLTEECNITNYDFEHIDQIVGVNRINSYSADVLSNKSKKRTCTALFCQMSLLNHDCLPNTRTVIYENPGDLSLSLGLFASIDIWKNQPITQQYYPVIKGTLVRRKALREWFFNCNCKRCSDPTEFETFFSCLSCWKCGNGFIVPVDSLDDNSIWKCNKYNECHHSLSPEKVQTIVTEAEGEISQNEGDVQKLEAVLNDLISRNQIHIRHYIAINLQYDIARKIVKALNNEREVGLIRRGSEYCKNILAVVNTLCPGFSYFRGVILYFLGNCLFALYELGELQKSDGGLKELKEIILEGIEIMEVEPEDSSYRDMVVELEGFSKTLMNAK